ncbi:thiamine phosphate synthase [Clostridium sp. DJ247]|uniref:thiamine phosphate synthase n=1 Tax=Clostridium sp. DJ247 TaxID=2726188 RepID=UPI0016263744|nr:thiamine phosphate synthase [Clostridium sp. DJ247]MBC2581841.1 thiamine phosphate synthase [Clostridium sp. DJ247]
MFELKGNGRIYVVTNRHLIKQGNIYDVVEKCASKGAHGLFLREKDLSYDELKEMAEGIKKITDNYGIPLIVNGNFQVAKEIGAYGFHIGFNGFRSMISKGELQMEIKKKDSFNNKEKYMSKIDSNSINNNIVGVSVHKLEEAVEAEKLGADYLIAGHVFETNCKPGLEGRGIGFIKEICQNVSIPVIAIGGINHHNYKEILLSGAHGVAIMSLAMSIV